MPAEFDVFLSHASADKPMVEALARRLQAEGLRPWLDKWNLIGGEAWAPAIEAALARSASCAVFVGAGGFGAWHAEEMWAAVRRRVEDRGRAFRVIPVLLPGVERPARDELPGFLTAATWVEFRETLDDPEAFRRLACSIRGIEAGPGPSLEGANPYRGLELFDVEHAPLFFGREALTERLLDKLRPKPGAEGDRFLAIVGASGSGKSSLARAGLMAALKDGKLDGSASWPRAICRPGPEPFLSLANALKEVALEADRALVFYGLKERKDRDLSLHVAATQALGGPPRAERLVVLVDQFEEVFTLCPDEGVRRDFIANLLRAAEAPGGRTVVVLTMRADFYSRCASYADLAAALPDRQVLVGPMTDDELRRAIERPARLAGLEPEPGLVELLLDDVRGRPGALPLLQFALQEVWRRRKDYRLTVEIYKEIGEIEGALQRKADEVYGGFTPEQQEVCRRVFLRLVQPGQGSEDTRRRASLREIVSDDPAQASAVRAVVDRLQQADSRLLTAAEDPGASGEGTLEVAHEALIRAWPQLREWIDADRAGLQTRVNLTNASHSWESAPEEQKRDFLYTGARLAVAEEWAAANRDLLNPSERAFLQAGRKAEGDRRTKAVFQGALIACLLPTLVLGAIAYFQYREANEQAEEARTQAKKASAQAEFARQASEHAGWQKRLAEQQQKVAEAATTDLLGMYMKPCELVGRIATADTVADAREVLKELLSIPTVADEAIRSELDRLRELLGPEKGFKIERSGPRPSYQFEDKDVQGVLLALTKAYSNAWLRRRDDLKARSPKLAGDVMKLQYRLMIQPVFDRAQQALAAFDPDRGYEGSRGAIVAFWSLYYGDAYLIESIGTDEATRSLGSELQGRMVRLAGVVETWRSEGRPPEDLAERIADVREVLKKLDRQLAKALYEL